MKTKLFLLLTAAMLLLSVNVSAQTKKAAEKKAVKTEKRATAKKAPAGTPLKGDVNEDGVVDVADIAAVIAIMKNGGGTGEETKYYWYVGTTKPTSLSQASTVTSYPEELTYTNNSGAKSHIFVLTNSNKNVTFINLATGNPVDQKEVDTTTISGYKIFETAVGTANTGTIKIRISSTYYWYVGTVNPMNVNTINPKDIVSDASSMGWRYIGATVPTYTMQNPLWNGQVNEIVFDNYKDITAYIALPNSVIKVRDGFGNDVTGQMKYLGEKEINGVTYTVYQNGNVVMAYSLDGLVY